MTHPAAREPAASSSARAVFDRIYATDAWTLGSGPGSLPVASAPFVELLETFVRANQVRRLVDFGCGDWQYMSRVDLTGVDYLGLDVAETVLASNQRRFARANVRFERTPDDLERLPEGDLIVFKDVLVHLPNAYVAEVVRQALRKFRFVLAVNNRSDDPAAYNRDIEVGGHRPVDLGRPPFSFRCATVLRFGPLRMPDPRMPWLVAVLRRKFVWPGLKHVQLLFGERT